MGFLKRFFHNVFREEPSTSGKSSFEHLSDVELKAHLDVADYGAFELTDAVRPSFDLAIVPQEGFRHDLYRDEDSRRDVPVLLSSISKHRLFEVFMDLLDPLGDEVDVVLETSHQRRGNGHEDFYREHMDLPVLKSILWDYEELLLNDGFTGLAVLNPNIPREVQFDEHKLLIMYSDDLSPFEEILNSSNVKCDEMMKFITEAEHVHSSNDEFHEQFQELQMRLGMDMGECYGGFDGYEKDDYENFV